MDKIVRIISARFGLLVITLSFLFYSVSSLAGICINFPNSRLPNAWYGDCGSNCGGHSGEPLDLSYDFTPSYSSSDPYGFNSFSAHHGIDMQFYDMPSLSTETTNLQFTQFEINQKLDFLYRKNPYTDLSHVDFTPPIDHSFPTNTPVITEMTEVNLDSQSFTNVRNTEEMEKIKKDFEEHGIDLDFFQADKEDEIDPDVKDFFQSDINDDNFAELNSRWNEKEEQLQQKIDTSTTLADRELTTTEKEVVKFVKELALDYDLSPSVLRDVINELRDEEFVGKNILKLSDYYDDESFSAEELMEVLAGKMPIKNDSGEIQFTQPTEYYDETATFFDEDTYNSDTIQEIKDKIKRERRELIAEAGELAISFIPVAGPPISVLFSQLVMEEFDFKNILQGFAWGTADIAGIGFLKKIKNVKKVASTASKAASKVKVTKKPGVWTATKKRTSTQNAFRHWKDHGREFPEFSNAKRYVEGIRKFFSNSPKGTLTKVRTNGDVIKYHPKSNTFAVMDKTGAPKTMFKPSPSTHDYKTNLEYFHAQ